VLKACVLWARIGSVRRDPAVAAEPQPAAAG
jgi:hypothetical protein